jgi:hypothetical protein
LAARETANFAVLDSLSKRSLDAGFYSEGDEDDDCEIQSEQVLDHPKKDEDLAGAPKMRSRRRSLRRSFTEIGTAGIRRMSATKGHFARRRPKEAEVNKLPKASTVRLGSRMLKRRNSAPELSTGSAPEMHVPVQRKTIMPKMSAKSNFLTDRHVLALVESLPKPGCYLELSWTRLYNSMDHGSSLRALYTHSNESKIHSSFFIVIQDMDSAIFGGYIKATSLSAGKNLDPHLQAKPQYTGSGESYVFTFKQEKSEKEVVNSSEPPIATMSPLAEVQCEVSSPAAGPEIGPQPKICRQFRWTWQNELFLLCTPDRLAMGGGGEFAFYLDGDLSKGSSGPSQTYGNTCLSESNIFDVMSVEVWGLSTIGLGLSGVKEPVTPNPYQSPRRW